MGGYARVVRCAAINDGPGVVVGLRELDEPTGPLVRTLHRHHVAELVIRAAASENGGGVITASTMRARLEAVRRTPPVESRLLTQAFDEAQRALAASEIPALILKGTVLAQRLYGGPDQRPQHDVDLLVPRRHARAAQRVLRRLGYRRSRRDHHAVTLWRGLVKLDLHWALRSAPAYTIDEDALWRDSVLVMADDVEAHTLSDEHLLTLLTVSIVEDAGRGMAKLKQLCDLWLLARELDAVLDWERWFADRSHEGLEAMVVNGCALALTVLDGAQDAPNLSVALARHIHTLRIDDRNHALALVSAQRGEATNVAWFASVYPGSALGFRITSFLAGFPASVGDVRPWRHVPIPRWGNRR